MSDRSAYDIMRAYGCLAPTVAELRAYVDVLDRMGAFTSSERVTLRDERFLGAVDPQESDGRVAHNPGQDDPAQAQRNRVRAT
ncbi:MAG: hypothetical protein ACRDK8_08340 [Solirubrobacteraceae bacterium]